MRVFVNGREMAARVDLFLLTPLDSDLSAIPTATVVVEDPAKTLTERLVPRLYHEVLIYDDVGTVDQVYDAAGPGETVVRYDGAQATDTAGALIFGGYVNTLTELPMHPVGRAWSLFCQNYTARTLETATGSLNKVGIMDSDRNFVIAIMRDAFDNQLFAGQTVDDAIIAANEPNWPGVAHTAFVSGLDWSYMSPANAVDNLLTYVPNVHWTVGKDRIVRYGILRNPAPFALSSFPNGVTTVGYENYVEEEVKSEHRNKMRQGGEAASEVTAYDEPSFAKFGVILDAGYRNDETIPEADLTRRTYAELRTLRTKRRANFTVRDEGLEVGMVVDVVNHRVGPGTRPGVMGIMDMAMARSASGAIAGERGRLLVTKVKTRPLGNQNYAYDVEAGDVVTDFPLQVL